jgi:hypothetical protein
MKLQKSLPQNAAFFEKYAALIGKLTFAATFAQLITGACEIGILYALLSSIFGDIVPPQYVGMVAMWGAVFCAVFLQIGLKQLFPQSVRQILFKRFNGLELWFSVAVFILTGVLLTGSIYLSWEGSKDIAEFAITPVRIQTTDKADSLKATEIATAQRLFTSDSATIETKYKGKSEALESELSNQIKAIERGGKRATTLRADLTTKLAKLQTDKATELEAKAADRKQTIDRATLRADTDAATIATDNKAAKGKVDQKQSRYKGYIGYFTMLCYVFFLLVYALNEMYHKGASIETKPIPSQRHFNPSVVAAFFETLKEKIDVWFRTKIQNWADKTPPQPLPNSESALYDFKTDVLTDTVKIETTARQMKVVKLPLKVPKVAAASADTEGGILEKPLRQIGFNKPKATETDSDQTTTASVSKTVSTASVERPNTRICLYCQTSFVYNIHNQKYCCEAHRIAAYEQRSGKRLEKKKTK